MYGDSRVLFPVKCHNGWGGNAVMLVEEPQNSDFIIDLGAVESGGA